MKSIFLFICFGLALVGHSQTADSVRMPNIFTPNNDGINDWFQIQSIGFKSLDCSIYNRYGGLVYRFYGLNGSWDGYTHAGVPCSEGVYLVIARFETENGTEVPVQGNVQLIRGKD